MAQPGILAWATSIRATMVNDPCRQSLEDQIQMHGFLFLDDYLNNILAQAKRDPIIDLVKTPGRKKDAPKKTRAAVAAAKAKSAVALSLEESDERKENQPPVNNFHQTLLQAKNKDSSKSTDELPFHQSNGIMAEKTPVKSVGLEERERQKEISIVEDVEMQDEQVVEEILSSPAPPSPAPRPMEEDITDSLPLPQVEQAKDLSIIAEDDESAERSVRLLGARPVKTNASRDKGVTQETRTVDGPAITRHAAMEVENDMTGTANVSSSSSGQTFHSVALDSPRPQSSTRASSNANSDYLTAPLPQMPQSHSGPIYPTENEAMTAPLPAIPSASTSNIMSVPAKEPPTQFPSLPAPSPLRKSMRVQREPSFGMGMGQISSMPTTTNAVVGVGKRTSWLMKAREVKAMEVPGKRVSALGSTTGTAPVPGMSGGLKRKSGEILGAAIPGTAGMMGLEEDERKRKIPKTSEGDIAVSKEKSKGPMPAPQQPSQLAAPMQPEPAQIAFPTGSPEEDTMSMFVEVPQEGMMDRLKRTVEGLGARSGKSINKSLGGPAAAAALAEAKAAKVAAEARIAERDGRSAVPHPAHESVVAIAQTTSVVAISKDEPKIGPAPPSKAQERKLSVSDLVTTYEDAGKGKPKENAKEVEMGFKPARASLNKNHVGDESTSTTPPNSPPSTRTSNSSFVLPSGPVFNKPPVFVPPALVVPPKDFSFNLPSTAFSLPPAPSLGIPARSASPASQKSASALSAQSTVASLFSDAVFDSQNDAPAWMPNTQDTEYSTARSESQKIGDLDEDDSWPMVDEKLAAANPSWTPFGFTKEDSMTWSTLPTESQRDIRSTQNHTSQSGGSGKDTPVKHVPGTFGMHVDEPNDDALGDGDLDLGESELDDLGLEGMRSTASLVKGPERSQSQMSMVSTSSSQAQIGWVGQATKLVSSVLGGSKSKKPQVPSLQRAAAAAKKEQDEKDKKAARMKEMENRRQLAIQRKAEEEKSKAMEEEKKIKEDGERRKREREENTDKRPLKVGTKKVDEDTTKKRKITVEVEKKPTESKKPPSKEKKDVTAPPRVLPPLGTSTSSKISTMNKSGGGFKPSASNPVLSSSATYNVQGTSGSTAPAKPAEMKTVKGSAASTTSSVKSKGKAKAQDDGISQPVHQLQTQMAARAKAQIQAAKQQAESENIELPDINSEYSDSDDEERPRTFDPPDWAQSPELRQQLHMQSTVNPDDIFGPIRPLKMEEVFRTRQSRFRARTSSANWTGNDRLTAEEEREYVRRMGFR